MVSDDEDLDCPLCMEEFDIADRNFRPCPCGYQVKRHNLLQVPKADVSSCYDNTLDLPFLLAPHQVKSQWALSSLSTYIYRSDRAVYSRQQGRDCTFPEGKEGEGTTT